MFTVVACSLQIESSPQALPLGASCILSALNSDNDLKPILNSKLFDWSLETSFSEKPISVKMQSDSEFIKNSTQKMFSEISKVSPDFVLCSVYVWNVVPFLIFAKTIKEKSPKTILICGGPEVTARPDFFISSNSCFDFAVVGEGEVSSVQLIKSILIDDYKPECIRGVWAKNNEKQFIKTRSESPDLNTLDSPYLNGILDPVNYGGVLWELARGCPFSCSYCYESRGEKKVRLFPLERIKKELQLFNTKNIQQIFVLDPTYNADKNRALQILEMIRKIAPDIYFNFEVRAEFLDQSLVNAFSKISCSLQIGLQSADENVLKLVNRNFNKKDFVKKIALLNNAGIVFGLDLMFGLPNDTVKNFLQSLDFAFSQYPNHLDLFRLSVLPGTDLHEKGKILGLIWNNEPPYNVIKTTTCTEQDLLYLQNIAKAVSIFYSSGRAVTWFLAVLQPLQISPSAFCADFATWINQNSELKNVDVCCLEHQRIEKIQIDFLKYKYDQKKLSYLFLAVKNIVMINGAFCRALAEESETILSLDWNPEDLLGSDSMDIKFFSEEVCKETSRVRVFASKSGPDLEYID